MMAAVVHLSAFSLVVPPSGLAGMGMVRIRSIPVVRLSAEVVGPEADECYLFDTNDGRKYVCTGNPDELAWYMGLELKDLKVGPKPDDLELVECAEDWSHSGTPQWVCKEEAQEIKEDGCEMIAETADEMWFKCTDDKPDGEGVACTDAAELDFGVGGGPGYLPQDDEVLCKQEKPKAS